MPAVKFASHGGGGLFRDVRGKGSDSFLEREEKREYPTLFALPHSLFFFVGFAGLASSSLNAFAVSLLVVATAAAAPAAAAVAANVPPR